jgi:hypothetical protein
MLHEVGHQAAICEFTSAKLPRKGASFVFERNGLDDPSILKAGSMKAHSAARWP